MNDAIGPPSRLPPLGDGRGKQRNRQGRSPYRSGTAADPAEADADTTAATEDRNDTTRFETTARRVSDALAGRPPETGAPGGGDAVLIRAAAAYGPGSADARPSGGDTDPHDADPFPPHLLNDRVQAAVTDLIGQMDTLRDQLTYRDMEMGVLRARAERDETLGTLNRAAVLARLAGDLERAVQESGTVVAALFYLESFEPTRQTSGLDEAMKALHRLALGLGAEKGAARYTGALGGAAILTALYIPPGQALDDVFRAFCDDINTRLEDFSIAAPDHIVACAALRADPLREDAHRFCRRLEQEMRAPLATQPDP